MVIDAKRLPSLGTVLVDQHGKTLYMFLPDRKHAVTCTGRCLGTWPPVVVGQGGSPKAGSGGVRQGLLGTVPDGQGRSVASYAGWPLYTYAGDTAPGQTSGQALDDNGGPWYVMRVDGHPVIPSGSPSPGASSTS
ncbi:hypothetical protein [Actinocatenispora thailandica]|uniref:COG4315 family predicted lipoprotein n=1 Tax=Actinocatenispora thailandica TaxID=227318 RepID=UPI0019528C88|nr:hypothetical protein [Actinocatenispora thailandica]